MPKVIGIDDTVAKRATCHNCGVINQYTPSEVRVLHEGRDISGSYEMTKGFNCGQCGSKVVTYQE